MKGAWNAPETDRLSHGEPPTCGSSPRREAPQASDAQSFISAAHTIGLALIERSHGQGTSRTWEISALDPVRPYSRRLLTGYAGPGLYQGLAGISLFLGELGRATGENAFVRVALEAASGALESAAALSPQAIGFFGGRTGVAWTLAHLASCSADDRLLDDARALLRPILPNAREDVGLDVIGGAAGAIGALLRLAHILDMPELTELAIACGDHILESVHPLPAGWGWPRVAAGQARELTGFAHGASGFAVALAELYDLTGNEAYRFGVVQAIAYEDSTFDREQANWPDYRNNELSAALADPVAMKQLARDVASGKPWPQWRPAFMHAWCHGAPGILLARARINEILQDRRLAQHVPAALGVASDRLHEMSDYSLCHGLLGNAEAVVVAASEFGEPSVATAAFADVAAAVERQTGRQGRWPSGNIGGVPDPSLMLGDAGIGLELLRLARGTGPDVLLVRGRSSLVPTPSKESTVSVATVRRHYAECYFPGSRAVLLRALGEEISPDGRADSHERGLFHVHERILQLVETAPPMCRDMLRDAVAIESARFRAMAEWKDYAEALKNRQILVDPLSIGDDDHWERASGVGVVWEKHDWQGWLAEPGDSLPSPREQEACWLLFPRERQLEARQVGRLAGTILSALAVPQTTGGIARAVAAAVGQPASTELQTTVRAQLAVLHREHVVWRCRQAQ